MPTHDLEAVYDQKIAPLMNQLLAICQEHHIPMLATFEYAEGAFATSFMENEGHPVFQHLKALLGCAMPEGINVDKFVLGMLKHYQGQPHSSLVLKQLGLPVNGPTPP